MSGLSKVMGAEASAHSTLTSIAIIGRNSGPSVGTGTILIGFGFLKKIEV